jgi:hypothetical protein
VTPATLSALLLFAAGFIHSLSFMCRKLPPGRRPAIYPKRMLERGLLDVSWVLLLVWGMVIAFSLSRLLGGAAALIYFVVLPFAFQPALARLLGYRNLRHYLDEVEKT